MFAESTRYYDLIYRGKDYALEATRLKALIREHKRAPGNRLLDVACGSGIHIAHLRDEFECEGGDILPEMLTMARARNPGVPFHRIDFTDFDLGRAFDVVTCLFSSIGYAGTGERLRAAVRCMARHLAPGGVLLIEPWFTREHYRAGTAHMLTVDEQDLKICRMNVSRTRDQLSILVAHYLVATPEDGVRHFVERHELAMFEPGEFADAARGAGLEHLWIEEGISDRGMHVLTAPSAGTAGTAGAR